MNTAKLTVSQIRGLVLASAKKDIRYYLNGTLFDFEAGRAVSTDGHCLLAVNIAATCVDVAYGQAIIPRDALETIAKGGKVTDTVDVCYGEVNGQAGVVLTRGDVSLTVAAIDGKFPQYDRVIPESPSGDLSQFNPELLARICKALTLALPDAPKTRFPHVGHNGYAGALVTVPGFGETAIAVCMPARIEPFEGDISDFWNKGKESKVA